MCNEKLWNHLFSILKDDFELISIPIPLEDNIEDIVDVLAKLFREETINLVGFSLGGYIASYFAVKYPHRIQKLFIIGSSPCSLSQVEIIKRKKAIVLIDKYGFKGLSRQKVISLLAQENQNNDELIILIQEMYSSLGEEVLRTQLKSTLKRKDLLKELSSLLIPMTFLYCDKDRLVNHSWLQEFSKISQELTLIKLIGFSHMIPLEKPIELSHEIKKWIENQRKNNNRSNLVIFEQ